jgi:hypothetical protein
MHIHLDALGGISGNMFIGALLDLRPELAAQLPGQLALAGFANLVAIETARHHDGVLTGTLATLNEQKPAALAAKHAEHPHRSWRQIRALLQDSRLAGPVKQHALGIFTVLAEAEARVHNSMPDEVEFHEVGAWDSIADIVCAAWLIAHSGATSWSVSILPLGRGTIATAHGVLPVPAPAVTLLLQGYVFHDDGREGERVTPTGAAILKYLQASQDPPRQARVLVASGQGFGTRRFAGLSNVLRALVFTDTGTAKGSTSMDSISVLSFEVDDQNPEDLAEALEQLRRQPGVIDVVQYAVHGKKQRLGSSVRVLVQSAAEADVQHQCFVQTTTLGIRVERVARSVLPRWEEQVALEGREYRVKLALRPDGQITAKAELDDLANHHLKQAERQLVREVVEVIAIERNLTKETAAEPGSSEANNDGAP